MVDWDLFTEESIDQFLDKLTEDELNKLGIALAIMELEEKYA